MENDRGVLILLIGLAAIASLLMLFVSIRIVKNFRRGKNYILTEMRRSTDNNEYRYWRRELRCHYLCLIPFVNERNVMRVYYRLFHRAKHIEKRKK